MNYVSATRQRLEIRAVVVTRLVEEYLQVAEIIRARGIDCYPVYSPSLPLLTLEYKTCVIDQHTLSKM
ncbi:MAG: hypothetical protein MUO40_00825 [Anaerolineaceae bacterium]|nr:hypothetical protein [Anaerolineaceae bacterium]